MSIDFFTLVRQQNYRLHMRGGGVEVEHAQGFGFVAEFLQASDVAVEGRGVAGDVDDERGVPGDDHLRYGLVQTHTRRVYNDSIHGAYLRIPLLNRRCEKPCVLQVLAGKGETVLVDLDRGDIVLVLEEGAERSHSAVEVHD